MCTESDELSILNSKYRAMNIQELKSNIEDLEEMNKSSKQLHKIDFAKNELKIKYKERQEQIDLLTQSLTSSSRVFRWVSSIKAIFQ